MFEDKFIYWLKKKGYLFLIQIAFLLLIKYLPVILFQYLLYIGFFIWEKRLINACHWANIQPLHFLLTRE